MLKLYNTLSRKLEEVKPNAEGIVTMYNCGPTVYSMQHIGNYRAYANWDILHRALLYLGCNVKRIMNITDVGHLVSDEDFGEDKMEKGAKSLNLNDPFEVAEYFIKTFLSDMYKLNMLSPSQKEYTPDVSLKDLKEYGWIRATESIPSMIELIQKMEANGFIYETDQAVYFDVTKYDEYTKLSGQRLEDKLVGVRDDVNVDQKKKHSADFVLWMKRYGEYKDHIMHWASPWGDGFPGWHIECSAMGLQYLGSEISIHTGGIEHIPVHHTNERAQNFGALEKEVVNMWVHNEHLQGISGDKLAKSAGNAYTMPDLLKLGYNPVDIRLHLISANYRIPLRFSLDSLESAKNTRSSWINKIQVLQKSSNGEGQILNTFKQKFSEALSNDLNMSAGLAVVSELLKSSGKPEDILATINDFDRVLGLNLTKVENKEVPEQVQKLADERELARRAKDFAKSDELRKRITELGFKVSDSSNGPIITKI